MQLYKLEIIASIIFKVQTQNYLVKTRNIMAEVNPRSTRFCHLMKKMIPKELQQVPVSVSDQVGSFWNLREGNIKLNNSCLYHKAVCLYFRLRTSFIVVYNQPESRVCVYSFFNLIFMSECLEFLKIISLNMKYMNTIFYLSKQSLPYILLLHNAFLT